MSPDFATHSVSYFVEHLLRHGDRKQFRLIAYSNVMKPDTRTQTFRNLFDEWRDISRLSALDAAELIARDGVDLLVELAGHTANNRLDVCALRPAPHQATYIGYPNTTGLTAVDYRFTDALADPLDTTQHFTEQLLRLEIGRAHV